MLVIGTSFDCRTRGETKNENEEEEKQTGLVESPRQSNLLPPASIRGATNCWSPCLLLSCLRWNKFGDAKIDTKATMNTNGNVIEKLSGSTVYQDYERAFSEATGLPVALRPIESWQLPHRGKRTENAFCAMMSSKSRSCAACLQTQQKLAERARDCAQSVTCAHGMTDTAVP